jgi:hypothetical protein
VERQRAALKESAHRRLGFCFVVVSQGAVVEGWRRVVDDARAAESKIATMELLALRALATSDTYSRRAYFEAWERTVSERKRRRAATLKASQWRRHLVALANSDCSALQKACFTAWERMVADSKQTARLAAVEDAVALAQALAAEQQRIVERQRKGLQESALMRLALCGTPAVSKRTVLEAWRRAVDDAQMAESKVASMELLALRGQGASDRDILRASFHALWRGVVEAKTSRRAIDDARAAESKVAYMELLALRSLATSDRDNLRACFHALRRGVAEAKADAKTRSQRSGAARVLLASRDRYSRRAYFEAWVRTLSTGKRRSAAIMEAIMQASQ